MTKSEPTKDLLAGRVRLAREMAGLTQAQAAKLLGLHRPSVSEMEAGRRKISAHELSRLGEIYAVSTSWLVSDVSPDADPLDERIHLAARQLANFNDKDLDRLMGILRAIRRDRDRGDDE